MIQVVALLSRATPTLVAQTRADNGVIVETTLRNGRFEVSVIWRERLLNHVIEKTPFIAGRLHEMFFTAWSQATESNLLDESADAPNV
jgi:hypothetical protein